MTLNFTQMITVQTSRLDELLELMAEWDRNQALLKAVKAAYRGQGSSGKNSYEAIQGVTGRSVQELVQVLHNEAKVI